MPIRFENVADDSLQHALREIARLGDLTPGWNSYRADSIKAPVRERARQFLMRLRAERTDIPMPIIGPSPDGGVVFQWREKRHEVEIVFLPQATEYSVARRGEASFLLEGDYADTEFLVKDVVRKYVLAE